MHYRKMITSDVHRSCSFISAVVSLFIPSVKPSPAALLSIPRHSQDIPILVNCLSKGLEQNKQVEESRGASQNVTKTPMLFKGWRELFLIT